MHSSVILPEQTTELHIPFYSYMGPGTHIYERIKNKVEPVNKLDLISMEHDVNYLLMDEQSADTLMYKRMDALADEDYLFDPYGNIRRAIKVAFSIKSLFKDDDRKEPDKYNELINDEFYKEQIKNLPQINTL